MKIAFVNQPIDHILPPFQSSVGACTYGAARSLAKFDDVVVYGLRDAHEGAAADFVEEGVRFRFFSASAADRAVFIIRSKLARHGLRMAPASSGSWAFPEFGRQVAVDLQRQRCDVIHVQHCSQYIPGIRALNPEAKIVLHLHAEWFSQNDRRELAQRLTGVDLITTVSNYITDKTRREFPALANRFETTYNGVDAAEFTRERDDQAASEREEKRILYAGAISPHKGVHILLEAFKIVIQHFPRVRLDIVGPSNSYPLCEVFDVADREGMASVAQWYVNDDISRLKARLSLAPPDAGTYSGRLKSLLTGDLGGKVTFHGMIPRAELIDRYYDADIFAFPPVWDEGFGIPPVEAMAASVPVVASRSGAVVETVVDGETGLLAPKNDAPALARALLQLLENDAARRSMGAAARKRALRYFTWDGVAAGMHERYEALREKDRALADALN